jgi:hypothetical protein
MISTYTDSEKVIITYVVSEYTAEDKTVEVTYENSEGLVHKRIINIPHLQDGSIDENYFQEILEGQLRGVEYNAKMELMQFIDPIVEEVVEEEVVEEEVVEE